MANGETWTFSANQFALEVLEELHDGVPAFAVLGDGQDYSSTRVHRLLFAFSALFRENDPRLGSLTYREFLLGPWMPRDRSKDWVRISGELGALIDRAFPEAIRQGAQLLMVTREAQRLGLSELPTPSSPSSEDGSPENLVTTPAEQ
jgi:hypothetical protein